MTISYDDFVCACKVIRHEISYELSGSDLHGRKVQRSAFYGRKNHKLEVNKIFENLKIMLAFRKGFMYNVACGCDWAAP